MDEKKRQGGIVPSHQGIVAPGSRAPGRSDPLSLMRRMIEDMDHVFDDFGFFGRSPDVPLGQLGRLAPIAHAPQIEVFQREGRLHVRADLPGLEPKDVQVHLEGDSLVIEGERKSEHETRHEGYFHSERSYGAFQRRVPLPRGIDPNSVDASVQNGVLEVTLALPQEAKRRIDVRSRGAGEGVQTTPANPIPSTETGRNGAAPPSARH